MRSVASLAITRAEAELAASETARRADAARCDRQPRRAATKTKSTIHSHVLPGAPSAALQPLASGTVEDSSAGVR